MSWLLGTILALPLGKVLGDGVGAPIFQRPVDFTFPLEGVGLWLMVGVVLAIVASLLPARKAARVSVREALAYE